MAGRPHVVVVPYPLIGQVNPMLPLAKLLHSKGFFVTFVNTDTSHRKILRSGGRDALKGSSRFRFETIPDGYSSPEFDGEPLDLGRLYACVEGNSAVPLAELLRSYDGSSDVPPATCIVSSFLATFANDVARELGIPLYMFWTTSAASLLGALHLPELVKRGYVPLKDESYLRNGYLDTPVDWIPGMKDIRLRDLSSFIRTTNLDDLYLNAEISELNYALQASGPLPALINEVRGEDQTISLRLNLRREDHSCLQWLDAQDDASVVYVSFGSLTTLTVEQLAEFAWGLADSGVPFLWIIRSDLVDSGGRAALPVEFIRDAEGRSFFADWCPQEEVLSHPSIGGFLMHAGWNSMMESICCGVPMICWPGFADQYTNCHYACKQWGIALEIDGEVKRGQVKDRIKEMMEGEKAEEMRRNAKKWKEMAQKAIKSQDGTSFQELEKLAKDFNPEGIDIVHDL